MASPSSLTELELEPVFRTRVDRIRWERRERVGRFPHDDRVRWAMRIMLALLVVGPALLAAEPLARLETPNQVLLNRIATIEWDRADQVWMLGIFPPLSTLLAAAASPLGRVGLSVIGAIVAGVFLQKLLESMVRRQFPPVVGVVLLIALAANPLFSYLATENLPAFLGLALFGIAIADVGRFVSWGDTQAGFRAGSLLMLAVLADGSAPVYVTIAGLAAPFLTLHRAGERGVRRANLLVVVYPAIAALGAFAVLNLIFRGRLLSPQQDGALARIGERAAVLPGVFAQPHGWLLLASLASAWAVGIVVRRYSTIAVSTLVFVAVIGAWLIGIVPSGSVGVIFFLMVVLAAALIPAGQGRVSNTLLFGLAAAQVLIGWLSALYRPELADWFVAMNRGLGLV